MNIDGMPLILFVLSPPFSAGLQKPRTMTASKIKYENFDQKIRFLINIYRTCTFYPIFTLAAAYIADNLCPKNGNSSFFKLKQAINKSGFKSRAAYDGARTVGILVWV